VVVVGTTAAAAAAAATTTGGYTQLAWQSQKATTLRQATNMHIWHKEWETFAK
jgi:hypothetical protein